MLLVPPAQSFGMGGDSEQDSQHTTSHPVSSGHDCCAEADVDPKDGCGTDMKCGNCSFGSAVAISTAKSIHALPASTSFLERQSKLHDSYALPAFRPPIA